MPRAPRLIDPVDASENLASNAQRNDPEGSGILSGAPDSIARRGYERFQERGREHGRDQEDWFEAERELTRNERG